MIKYSELKRVCEEHGISAHTYMRVTTLESSMKKGLTGDALRDDYLAAITKTTNIYNMENPYGTGLLKEYEQYKETVRKIAAEINNEPIIEGTPKPTPFSNQPAPVQAEPDEEEEEEEEEDAPVEPKVKVQLYIGRNNYDEMKEISNRSGVPLANVAVMMIDSGLHPGRRR